jgi:hypothetical protein
MFDLFSPLQLSLREDVSLIDHQSIVRRKRIELLMNTTSNRKADFERKLENESHSIIRFLTHGYSSW